MPHFFVWLYKNSHLRGKISFCLAKYSLLSAISLSMWQKDIFKMSFKNVCKIQNCKRNDIFINHFVLVFIQKIKNRLHRAAVDRVWLYPSVVACLRGFKDDNIDDKVTI